VATFSAFAPLRTALLWTLTLGLLLPVARAQLSTPDHLQDPGFWPTQPGASRGDYTGPEACRQCHAEKFADQAKTAMRRTMLKPSASEALRTHPQLTFDVGPYRYIIESDAQHSLYTQKSSRAYALIVRARCAQGDLGNAKAALAQVSARDRSSVVRACGKLGIELN